jgi:hypothetical protein
VPKSTTISSGRSPNIADMVPHLVNERSGRRRDKMAVSVSCKRQLAGFHTMPLARSHPAHTPTTGHTSGGIFASGFLMEASPARCQDMATNIAICRPWHSQ